MSDSFGSDMLHIPWADLGRLHCAIIDASTVDLLVNGNHARVLNGKFPNDIRRAQAVMDTILTDSSNLTLLNALAQFVAYDHLCVDRRALSSLGLTHLNSLDDDSRSVFSRALKTTDFPVEVVLDLYRGIVQDGEPYWQAFGIKDKNDEWFIGEDKTYFDLIADEATRTSRSWPGQFDVSDQHSGMRAYLYAEMAAQARVPAVLHPARIQILESVGCQLRADAVQIVEHKMQQDFVLNANSQLEDLLQNVRFEMPSVGAYIIAVAKENRISLLEAAVMIHDSKEAQAFRKWLWTLHEAAMSGPATLINSSALKELETACRNWATSFDPNVGVYYQIRKVDFSAIPRIGWLIKLAGIAAMTSKRVIDPIIGSPGLHLQFIARMTRLVPAVGTLATTDQKEAQNPATPSHGKISGGAEQA